MVNSEPNIPQDDAVSIVERESSEITISRRKVAVRDAVGQTLAEDQLSRLNLPPFDKSAMDGYAVRAEDVEQVPVKLNIIEEIPAGAPWEGFTHNLIVDDFHTYFVGDSRVLVQDGTFFGRPLGWVPGLSTP